jgi:hypothetical protein
MRSKRTSSVILCWLVCQLVALAAPLAFGPATAMANAEFCVCPGGGGTECPMHKEKEDEATEKSGIRNSCAPPNAALLSLAAGLGILEPAGVLTIDLIPAALDTLIIVPPTRTELPDSPPPRA